MSPNHVLLHVESPAIAADRAAHDLVASPRTARTLAGIIVALFVAVALSLVLLPWQQTSVGAGRVVAYAPLERQQNVEAPIEGRVVRVFVREGSRVRRGESLLDLTDNDPLILDRLQQERSAAVMRIEAARARAVAIEARVAELTRSRDNALAAGDSRIRMATNRVRAATQALAATEAAQRTAQLNFERQEALVREGLASTRTIELATLDQIRTRTEVDRARASLEAARAEVEAITADRQRAGTDGFAAINDGRATRASVEAEIAAASAEIARMDVRLARQQTQRVVAPRDGTVMRLMVNTGGEMVKAGDPLLVFVPDTDERAVELWVDGNDIPLVREGRLVRIQFEGWPAIQFSGWPNASIGTFGGRVAVVDATDNGRGQFRVIVVADGREGWPSGRYLRQGVRANGWILLNRVRLGFELWRLFNGFPPALTPSEMPGYQGSGASSGAGYRGGGSGGGSSGSGGSK